MGKLGNPSRSGREDCAFKSRQPDQEVVEVSPVSSSGRAFPRHGKGGRFKSCTGHCERSLTGLKRMNVNHVDAGSSPVVHPNCGTLSRMTFRRSHGLNSYLSTSFAIASVCAVGFVGTVLVAPNAGAARPRCVVNATWQHDGTSWKFSRCVDGFTQAERTGTMGACWKEYPTWSLYTGPESDCSYVASGGPL